MTHGKDTVCDDTSPLYYYLFSISERDSSSVVSPHPLCSHLLMLFKVVSEGLLYELPDTVVFY